MEPRKITGLTVDPGDGSPLIDVDTAILALHEQLGKEGAKRAQNALGALINYATTMTAEAAAPWYIFENTLAGPMQREIERYDYAGRSIHLVPVMPEPDADGEDKKGEDESSSEMDRHVEAGEERIREDGRR